MGFNSVFKGLKEVQRLEEKEGGIEALSRVEWTSGNIGGYCHHCTSTITTTTTTSTNTEVMVVLVPFIFLK
jgi:hypothetical protein